MKSRSAMNKRKKTSKRFVERKPAGTAKATVTISLDDPRNPYHGEWKREGELKKTSKRFVERKPAGTAKATVTISLDDPRNPYHGEWKRESELIPKIVNADTRNTFGGVISRKPVNGLAAGVFKKR